MTLEEIMALLRSKSSEKSVQLMMRHGAPANNLGVPISVLKEIKKKTKVNHRLALGLFSSGVPDAQYLAGLIADPKVVKSAELDDWAKHATWHMISVYSVGGLSADSPLGWEKGLGWIDAKADQVALAGWASLGGWVSRIGDEELDMGAISKLMHRAAREIGVAPDRIRLAMNDFVICVGCYVSPLVNEARDIAHSIGKVEADMGETSCKIPNALDYINKVEGMGRLGRKKKMVRC